MEENREQPIVSITTRLDYEEYKKYANFVHFKEKEFKSVVLSTLFILIPIGFLFLVIYWGLKLIEVSFLGAAMGIFWGTGIFLILFMAQQLCFGYIAFTAVMRTYKQYRRLHEADSHEIFYEDYLLTSCELPEITSNSRISYDYYAEVIETESAFYLAHAIGKNKHGIFPKRYMTPEQQQALRELLMRKFGEKFKGIE